MRRRLLAACAIALPVFAAPVQAQDYTAEFDRQWGLRMIGVDKALALGLDGAGVLVGVTDTGLDTGLDFRAPLHPELVGRYIGLGSTAMKTRPWYSTAIRSSGQFKYHGTHVAGTIAANRDGVGMVGVASGASIVPMRMIEGGGTYNGTQALAFSVDYGLRNGVRIFNASWGTESWYDTLVLRDSAGTFMGTQSVTSDEVLTVLAPQIASLRSVVEADGVMVFANGNLDSRLPLGIQAALPYYAPDLERGWLAVTAVGPTLQQAWYAQACSVGMMWCLAAPGGDQTVTGIPGAGDGGIYATQPVYRDPANPYISINGTSMAAPHVSGALAIAKQLYPNASYQQLRTLVLNTATDIGAAGIDPIYGWGLLNVANLVATAEPAAGTIYAQQAWNRSVVLDEIMDRVTGRSVSVDAARPYGWWVAPFAGFGSVAGAGTDGAGLAGGVDFAVTPSLSLGLFAGGSSGSVQGGGASANDAGLHGGATLAFDNDALFADLTLGVSSFGGNAQRNSAPGLVGTVLGAGVFAATAATADTALWGGAELGYRFNFDGLKVAPYVFGRGAAKPGRVLGKLGERAGAVWSSTGFGDGRAGLGRGADRGTDPDRSAADHAIAGPGLWPPSWRGRAGGQPAGEWIERFGSGGSGCAPYRCRACGYEAGKSAGGAAEPWQPDQQWRADACGELQPVRPVLAPQWGRGAAGELRLWGWLAAPLGECAAGRGTRRGGWRPWPAGRSGAAGRR
ncbi:MAG TPA: S8 family peptidase [Devosia sp.]|jgi:hypothetical protein|uniref:S8 family peptidase n=1 Tax=Devosia sp. TaxID=1871048 RepID=UPI002F939F11